MFAQLCLGVKVQDQLLAIIDTIMMQPVHASILTMKLISQCCVHEHPNLFPTVPRCGSSKICLKLSDRLLGLGSWDHARVPSWDATLDLAITNGRQSSSHRCYRTSSHLWPTVKPWLHRWYQRRLQRHLPGPYSLPRGSFARNELIVRQDDSIPDHEELSSWSSLPRSADHHGRGSHLIRIPDVVDIRSMNAPDF